MDFPTHLTTPLLPKSAPKRKKWKHTALRHLLARGDGIAAKSQVEHALRLKGRDQVGVATSDLSFCTYISSCPFSPIE
jgi:hypothetical protein